MTRDEKAGMPPSRVDSEYLPVEHCAELQFSKSAAKLVGKDINDGEVLVVYVAKQGTTAPEPVIEKTFDVLDASEIQKHWPLVQTAIRKEVKSWHELGTFKMRRRSELRNILDSRWVFKWKSVEGRRIIKARLTVRGFKDVQQEGMSTYAGTASRWAQKFLLSIAAQHSWRLKSADVGAAFLKGITFQELHELTGEPLRKVAFDPPRGFDWAFSELPGMSSFCPWQHALEMLKPGFGLKDAPRVWRIKLDRALRDTGVSALKTDRQVYFWKDAKGNLEAIATTHVDDLKLAGNDDKVSQILAALTKEFGQLTVQEKELEHCGIIHEQQDDGSIEIHQNHYAAQIRPLSNTHFREHADDEVLTKADHQTFRRMLGAATWLTQTRHDVAVYIAALQRVAEPGTARYNHLQKLNRVMKWVKRRPFKIRYKRLTGPVKVIAITDSAFRKEDKTGMGDHCDRRGQNTNTNVRVGHARCKW